MSDRLDLDNYTAHRAEAFAPARQGLAVAGLVYVAHRLNAFALHHLAEAEAVADTSAAVDSLVVAVDIGLAVVAAADTDRDRHAVEEAGHMHRRAGCLEAGSDHARRCGLEQMPEFEQRLE